MDLLKYQPLGTFAERYGGKRLFTPDNNAVPRPQPPKKPCVPIRRFTEWTWDVPIKLHTPKPA